MIGLNLQFFGGCGAGGTSATGGTAQRLKQLTASFKASAGANTRGTGTGVYASPLKVAPYQLKGDYTDDNNPELVKFQGQTDDKSASFLAKVDKTTDLKKIQQSTGDKWDFYNSPYAKLGVTLGLNKKPTVLSEKDFNNYVKTTGATVLYRGWSGQDSIDRFKSSPNSHPGNGINGDGYYFTADKRVARNYARVSGGSSGRVMKAALSPNARVVSIDTLNRQINRLTGTKFGKALTKAGSYGSRTYSSNDGQAQLALKMGYNCIDAGWAVVPLTRDAVVASNRNVR